MKKGVLRAGSKMVDDEKIPVWEPVELMPKGKTECQICPYTDAIKKIQKDIKQIKKRVE